MQNGAKLRTFPFFNEAMTTFNIEAFRGALAEREGQRSVVVLNFPNNPTGYHPSKDEAAAIVKALTEAAEAAVSSPSSATMPTTACFTIS